ncbi:MAG: hypothetical protein ABSF18_07680 [Gammaproteobacteria bacterium]|jgi:hypothetical protein
MEPQGVVLTSTGVLLGSTVGGHLAQYGTWPSEQVIVGGFFAMLGCSILAEVNGELGEALAILIAGSALVIYGIPAINNKYPKKKAS